MQQEKGNDHGMGFDPEITHPMSMLLLGSTDFSHGHCELCGSSLKKRSSSDLHQELCTSEPLNKKVMVDPTLPPKPRSISDMVSSPVPTSTVLGSSLWTLRRCNSAPDPPSENNNLPPPSPQKPQFLDRSQSFPTPSPPAAQPPVATALDRLHSFSSSSDTPKTPMETEMLPSCPPLVPSTIPSAVQEPTKKNGACQETTTTPPTKDTIRSSDFGQTLSKITNPALSDPVKVESSATKLQRPEQIKKRLIQINECCNEIMQEVMKEEIGDGTNNKEVSEINEEESVTVGREGEGFSVHYKCGCGKMYCVLII
uniref:Uncharacterized protein n=1 Tax=Nelumbo nucifera TaxID=4432 RepID=A0A822Z1S2_NELNU|nr:TPA_asm: hypothetical protein HUJ06_008272 [Nelumbo nucifera]